VLTFGTFDGVHPGHRAALAEARALGDSLLVIVTRDAVVEVSKGRRPRITENERMDAIRAQAAVTEVRLGESEPGKYGLLRSLKFNVLAIGYDQSPDNDAVKMLLEKIHKPDVSVVRLSPFKTEIYKSSMQRD